jgi:hypothetical protein
MEYVYEDSETKKQGLPTKFLKSEKIYQRRVSPTTPREWPAPSITAKGPAAQVTFLSFLVTFLDILPI